MAVPTDHLALYHFPSCPFCVRVFDALERLGLDVERRDIMTEERWRDELYEATGRWTVPCLRIETADAVQWMHESADIVAWLERVYA
ncbi:MAG: glutaredoxin family protein [Planctomycetota bacterium]